ncbi:hypothetical protein MAR_022068 [Mya arenaria]|uniref:Uncharacterized protein n=1 Tax=Mya arenaria TaxID=6604 RepID=A0ABY7DLY1_MYAAR|nr:hypothetical protein MAR_022068 [Mya arenaria]
MFRMHKREALRRVDESAEEGDIVTHTENYQDKRHHNSQTITRSQEPYSCARSSRPNQNGMRKGRTLVSNTNIRQDPVQTHVLHGIEETKNYALHRDSMPKNANDVPRDTKPTEPNQNENVIEVFIRESIRSEIVRAKPAEYKCFDAVVVYDSRDYDYVLQFKSFIESLTKEIPVPDIIRIELFDSEQFAQSKIQVIVDILSRSCIVFFYLSQNSNTPYFNLFCEEATARTFLESHETGTEMLPNSILKPVHSSPKFQRNYKTPPGFLALQSIDWFDRESPFTREKVITVLKEAVVVRKRKEIDANVKRNFKYAHELQKKLDLSS